MTKHHEHADDDRLELEPQTVKDLDVDERDAEHVQGGVSAGPTRPGSIQSLNVRG